MKFSEDKALEAAAFFLRKGGNRLEIKKLMKLMYLAERRSVKDYGELLVGDNPCSLEQGPVLSRTYNLAKLETPHDLWDAHLSRNGIMVILVKDVANRYLSRADLRSLEQTWIEFGSFSPQQLTDYTHDNCAEWTDPGKSSLPIEHWEFARGAGHNEETATLIGKRIVEQRNLSISLDRHEQELAEA